ncbi:MAG: hypothetical protein H5T73_02830 [Actinobacteria bacterium]|nr:hypothetical protein [Actinomycetota bacterium]
MITARQSKSRMVIRCDAKRVRRITIYGLFLVMFFIVPAIVFAIKDGVDINSASDLSAKLVFPAVALVGTVTVLYRERSLIIIDKAKGILVIRRPADREMAGSYPLDAVSEVRLRHHGNPYYFPKLSILLSGGQEVILSSDVLLAMPLAPAVPLHDHVKRERALGRDIAAFIGVPFREIKGGDVAFGLDQADKEVGGADGDEKET